MGQITRAGRGCGLDSIDCDHEHLQILITLAERSAVNGDRRHCGQMLQRAAGFLESHAGREEHLLTRCGYPNVLEVRRGHEHMMLSLEQALTRLHGLERLELIDEIRRVAEYLAERIARDTQAVARFLAQPGRQPKAAAVTAAQG